jgi:hypothetical protein
MAPVYTECHLGPEKKFGYGRAEQRFQTEAEYADAVYIATHRWRILDKLKWTTDASVLKQVAAVIGYKETS